MSRGDERSQASSAASNPGDRRAFAVHGVSPYIRRSSYSSLDEALGNTRPPGSSSVTQPGNTGVQAVINPAMNPDNRYNYTTPSGMASAYEYPSTYPPSPYDASQFSHGALPPMRSGSAQSQSPPAPSQYTTPTYQQSYTQSQYTMQQPTQQWSGQSWEHQPHGFPSGTTESTFVAGRGDPSTSPPVEQRPYQGQHFPSAPNRRPDDRNLISPEVPNQPKGKERDRNPPNADHGLRAEPLPQGIDFTELLDSYHRIITGCSAILSNPLTNQGRPPTLDLVDSMLRSATTGRQLLDGHNTYPPPPERRSSNEQSIDEPKEPIAPPAAPGPKRQPKTEVAAPEGQTCLGCGATSTPEWRRGPLGPRTLCNACGLVYAKLIKKRSRDVGSNTLPNSSAAAVQGDSSTHPHGEDMSSGEGGSDDEHSYGSQDRRSEAGDYARHD